MYNGRLEGGWVKGDGLLDWSKRATPYFQHVSQWTGLTRHADPTATSPEGQSLQAITAARNMLPEALRDAIDQPLCTRSPFASTNMWERWIGFHQHRPLFNAASVVPSLGLKSHTLEDVAREGVQGSLFMQPIMHQGSRYLDPSGLVPTVQPQSITEGLGYSRFVQTLAQCLRQAHPPLPAQWSSNPLFEASRDSTVRGEADDPDRWAPTALPMEEDTLHALQAAPSGPGPIPLPWETDRSDVAKALARAPLPTALAQKAPPPTAGIQQESVQENAGNYPGQHTNPITGALEYRGPFGAPAVPQAEAEAAKLLGDNSANAQAPPGAAAGGAGMAAGGGLNTALQGKGTFIDQNHPFVAQYGSTGVPQPITSAQTQYAAPAAAAPAAAAPTAGANAGAPLAAQQAAAAAGGSSATPGAAMAPTGPAAPAAATPGQPAAVADKQGQPTDSNVAAAQEGAAVAAELARPRIGSAVSFTDRKRTAVVEALTAAGEAPAKRRRRTKYDGALDAVLQRAGLPRSCDLKELLTRSGGLLSNTGLQPPLSEAERAMIRGLHEFSQAYPDQAHLPDRGSKEWRLLTRRVK